MLSGCTKTILRLNSISLLCQKYFPILCSWSLVRNVEMGFAHVTLDRLLHLPTACRCSHSWSALPSSPGCGARGECSCPRAGGTCMAGEPLCWHLGVEHRVGGHWGPSPNLSPAGAVGLCGHSALSLSSRTCR